MIATLLDLKLDQVIARDAAVRRRRFTLYVFVLLLVAAAALSLIWYNVPHTAHYMDYTYRWEKPVGLQAVSYYQFAAGLGGPTLHAVLLRHERWL